MIDLKHCNTLDGCCCPQLEDVLGIEKISQSEQQSCLSLTDEVHLTALTACRTYLDGIEQLMDTLIGIIG